MNPFQYQRATDAVAAVQALSPHAKVPAGGTNLIDLMKNGVERPEKLIDINKVCPCDHRAAAERRLAAVSAALARDSFPGHRPNCAIWRRMAEICCNGHAALLHVFGVSELQQTGARFGLRRDRWHKPNARDPGRQCRPRRNR